MKVLVTGASGFVGQHIIPQLLKRGHTVTAVARNDVKARSFTWFNRVHFFACDIHCPITDPFDQFGQPDAVIHLAWAGLPNYSKLYHFEENLLADYRFLKSLVENGVKQILVAGTCFEYGMQNGKLTEDMPTAPASPYALAKDTLRKFLQSLQQQHTFTLQWARLFYIYGEGQNPSSLLAQLDQAIADGEPEFNMSGGEQLRDYLPVEEVARQLVLLLDHPKVEGVVNICSGKPISVRCLAEQHMAKHGTNMQLNLGHYPYPDYEPMAFWGSGDKLTRSLGSATDPLKK